MVNEMSMVLYRGCEFLGGFFAFLIMFRFDPKHMACALLMEYQPRTYAISLSIPIPGKRTGKTFISP